MRKYEQQYLGNKETVRKGWRLLLKMIQKENMSLVNADKHRCKGYGQESKKKRNQLLTM